MWCSGINQNKVGTDRKLLIFVSPGLRGDVVTDRKLLIFVSPGLRKDVRED